MTDISRLAESRGYAQLSFETERPCAPSRRSSISSRAESEVSVFSERSIASSRSSISVNPSSGWESSTQYDSDEENFLGIDVLEQESAPYSTYSNLNGTNSDPKLQAVEEGCSSRNTFRSDGYPTKNNINSASVRRDTAASTNFNSGPVHTNAEGSFARPLHPSQIGRTNPCSKPTLSHPRRTATDPGWIKPSLVTQDERRLNFVENLVVTATDLVAIIWPTSASPVFPDGMRNGTPIISLRYFIRETLRRSRTSFSTLQVAMYYLALLNLSGKITKCDFTKEERSDDMSGRALQCGRRMFLASLILASKYLQDRNYFTKAWSRISNLSVAEINRNEMALLSALEYKLHVKATEFQRWTECISVCTASVQRGLRCPWVEALQAMNMWSMAAATSDDDVSGMQSFGATSSIKAMMKHQPCSTTIPNHRLGLFRAGSCVNPTRPTCLPTRPPVLGNCALQWPGMASHLGSMARCSLGRGNTAARTSRPAPPAHGVARAVLPLSPPKTPSPLSREEYVDAVNDLDPWCPAPPPAPREPLVSLNTTPDSNDGASTFGNYLSPITSDSAQGTISGNAQPAQLVHSSGARFQADALDHDESASSSGAEMSNLTSRSSSPSEGSFNLPLPVVKHMEYSQKVVEQHLTLDVMDTDDDHSDMEVMADDKVAVINSDIEAETRRLTRIDLTAHSKRVSPPTFSRTVGENLTEPIYAIPAEDSNNRSGAKQCHAQKQPPCHRKKRGASSIGGGLPLRTKKAMRV